MPPPPQSSGKHRLSMAPQSATASASSNKNRQLSHLNSQLTQLHAHLEDLEDLVRMTAVQAEHIRALGGIHGALYVAHSSSPWVLKSPGPYVSFFYSIFPIHPIASLYYHSLAF